jgi:hypothetical protein
MLALAWNPASHFVRASVGRRKTPSATCPRWAIDNMALIDYQKLCPRSGHVLSREERDALGSATVVARRAPTIRCETCGRDVELVVHPGTGRSYIYPMHVKACASACPNPTAAHQPRTP